MKTEDNLNLSSDIRIGDVLLDLLKVKGYITAPSSDHDDPCYCHSDPDCCVAVMDESGSSHVTTPPKTDLLLA